MDSLTPHKFSAAAALSSSSSVRIGGTHLECDARTPLLATDDGPFGPFVLDENVMRQTHESALDHDAAKRLARLRPDARASLLAQYEQETHEAALEPDGATVALAPRVAGRQRRRIGEQDHPQTLSAVSDGAEAAADDDDDKVEAEAEWDPGSVGLVLAWLLMWAMIVAIMYVLSRRMISYGGFVLLSVMVLIGTLPNLVTLLHVLLHQKKCNACGVRAFTPWQLACRLSVGIVPATLMCILALYQAEKWYDPLPITIRGELATSMQLAAARRNQSDHLSYPSDELYQSELSDLSSSSPYYLLTLTVDRALGWPCACPQSFTWPLVVGLVPASSHCLQASAVVSSALIKMVIDNVTVHCGGQRFPLRTPRFHIDSAIYEEKIPPQPYGHAKWSSLQFLQDHWWSAYVWAGVLCCIILFLLAIVLSRCNPIRSSSPSTSRLRLSTEDHEDPQSIVTESSSSIQR